MRALRARSRGLSGFWRVGGWLFHWIRSGLGIQATSSQSVGPYGPFRFNGDFALADFAEWGRGHNNGFVACVEASRGKSCVIDVGAHVGLVTIPVAHVVAAGGVVHSIEPAAVNRKHLEQHVKLNGLRNVVVHDCVIGATDEATVSFYEMDIPTGQSGLAVKKNPEAYSRTSVRQVRLDTLAQQHTLAPDVIKIDVEGAEVGVLLGGGETIRRHRPLIVLSVHPKHLALLGHSLTDLESVLAQLGYAATTISGEPITEYRLEEYLLTPLSRP